MKHSVVWQCRLQINTVQTVMVPPNTVPISVQFVPLQHQELRLWCWVKDFRRAEWSEPLTLFLVETGTPFPEIEGLQFLDTVQDGSFVWHVFYGAKQP
jgi:hypothetical protein